MSAKLVQPVGLKVIGVTGAYGKTSTACLIASVLKTAGYEIGLLGSLGYTDGRQIAPSTHSTPPPDVLADWLSRMAGNGCSHAVIEVSTRALEESWLAGITLDAACICDVEGKGRQAPFVRTLPGSGASGGLPATAGTGAGKLPAGTPRLTFDGPLGQCQPAESHVLTHLSAEGLAVLSADDAVARSFLSRIDRPVLTVGIESPAEIMGSLIERFPSEQTFLLTAGSLTMPVRTQMIGNHHITNCLMAAAVGLASGIDLPTVVRGLEAVEHVPGRLERIECGQPFSVFVDVARTPEAMERSLATLREVIGGRLICVFGAGGDRHRDKRPKLGRAVELAADVAVLSSDNPRNEDAGAIIEEIRAGMCEPAAAVAIPDRAEAIAWALSQARPGDGVLIAGKGHQKHQIIGNRRIEFDDCQVARRWLYESWQLAVDSWQ